MADEKTSTPASTPKKPAPQAEAPVKFSVERLVAEGDVILNCNRGDVAGAFANEDPSKEFSVEDAAARVEKWRQTPVSS